MNPNNHFLLTPRRKTRTVHKGSVAIGSDHPVSVQSMTKTDTENVEGTIREILDCAEAGVDIMRVAVPHQRAADALPAIVEAAPVPIVADIHFNPRMAFEAIAKGAHCIRINPGNINDPELVAEIVKRCKDKGLAMRVGVNSGSILPREGLTVNEIEVEMVDFMVKEAVRWATFVDEQGFHNFTVSIKSSDVGQTIAANRKLAPLIDNPIHMGVTHAGTPDQAKLKTALAFGTLISEGIGDTVRVSITAKPRMEVEYAIALLAELKLRTKPIEVIACPSCGRADVDVEKLTLQVESQLKALGKHVTVSVLGCAVNGPGEAAEADYGIVASKGFSFIYRGREKVKRVRNEDLVSEFIALIDAEVPAPQTLVPAGVR